MEIQLPSGTRNVQLESTSHSGFSCPVYCLCNVDLIRRNQKGPNQRQRQTLKCEKRVTVIVSVDPGEQLVGGTRDTLQRPTFPG